MKPLGISLSLGAILSAFFLPWPATALLAILAALFAPPVAFVAGCLVDFLYSGGGFPWFALCGLIVALIAQYVQTFIKTRIM